MGIHRILARALKPSVENLATRGVVQKADPLRWKEHRYGLPIERWKALRGRSFWITGAGTGYGRSLAVSLACAGAKVFITGRRVEKLRETIEEMKALSLENIDCHIIEADITDMAQVKAACSRVKALCATLTGLVNNAALAPSGISYPMLDEPLESWERLMRTNVTGHLLLTREIFAHMVSGGISRVLFITSEAGWAFTPGFGQYNVSKAALNSLCSSMAEECAARFPGADIQINGLVPGEARTEMNRDSEDSPYCAVSMALILLTHASGGPNGKFFHRDGRHLRFAYAQPYEKQLL